MEVFIMTDEEIGKRLQQLPPEVQCAIVHCMPNTAYGASWGLCNAESVKDYLPYIKDNSNMLAYKIKGGIILQVDGNYLLSLADNACKGIIDREMIQRMIAKQQRATEDIKSYFRKLAKKEDGSVKTVGLYCTNLTPNIRHNDVDYPAFRVDIMQFLGALQSSGYGVVQTVNGSNTLLTPETLANSLSPMKDLSSVLLMSPTKTGVFAKIKKM